MQSLEGLRRIYMAEVGKPSLSISSSHRLVMANGSYIQPIIQALFERNPGILETTGPDQFGQQDSIVVTAGTAGVAINFFDCRNNNIDFPMLIL